MDPVEKVLLFYQCRSHIGALSDIDRNFENESNKIQNEKLLLIHSHQKSMLHQS